MSQQCPICGSDFEDGLAVCPSCGFRMIEATQGFKPVKFGLNEFSDLVSKPHAYFFRIVRGPQTGVELELKEGILTIGRDPSCDLFLNDTTVSRLHARIEVGGKGVVITDQNSFNGVWVNNKSVASRVLADGDIVQIGVFCLLYQER